MFRRIFRCAIPCVSSGRSSDDDHDHRSPRLHVPKFLSSATTTSRFTMADVRALLRQQRQARRIEHPHASYSDAGKLLCTLCREQIRAESQWESHIKSTNHQRLLIAVATTAQPSEPALISDSASEKTQVEPSHAPATTASAENGSQEKPKTVADGEDVPLSVAAAQSHKRKIDDDDDYDANAMDLDEAVRRKRSRAEISIDVSAANEDGVATAAVVDKDTDASSGTTPHPPPRREANRTPPTLTRRMSSTPSRGVELQIPSRPATPAAHRDSSSSSTPGGSALAGLTAASAAMVAATAAQQSSGTTPSGITNGGVSGGISTQKLGGHAASASSAVVDEDEWAAFEAEMAATVAPYADDAVISAPAMNAEESAAAAATDAANGEGDGASSRKSRADLDIEGEREDATRALEDEFDDMQELEARVKRLKEKREELRKRSGSLGRDNAPARLQSQLPTGDDETNGDAVASEATEKVGEEEGTEDDDDDDDEEDDWDGFRFRK